MQPFIISIITNKYNKTHIQQLSKQGAHTHTNFDSIQIIYAVFSFPKSSTPASISEYQSVVGIP